MYIPLSLDCSTRQTRKYPILRVDEPLACIFLVSRVLILLFFFLNFFHLLFIYYSFIIFSSCFLSSICAICAIFVCRSASILLRTHPVSTATRRLQLKLHLQPHLFFFLSLSLSLLLLLLLLFILYLITSSSYISFSSSSLISSSSVSFLLVVCHLLSLSVLYRRSRCLDQFMPVLTFCPRAFAFYYSLLIFHCALFFFCCAY